MKLKSLAAATVLASSVAIGGIAFAQTTSVAPLSPRVAVTRDRTDASDRNILAVMKHIERLIDHLQRDSHDYGGHRVKAIALLHEADEQLRSALAVDNNRPH